MGNKDGKKKSPMDQLYDASYEMKFQARQLEKEAQRAQLKEAQEKKKAKIYMDKGDMESAKIIAGEAIRYRQEATHYYRLGAKMTAVSSKLDSAVRTQQVSEQIKNAVPSLKAALSSL